MVEFEISRDDFDYLKRKRVNAPIVFNYCDDLICSDPSINAEDFNVLQELEVRNYGDHFICICTIMDFLSDGKILFTHDDYYKDAIVYVLVQKSCRILRSKSHDKRPVVDYVTPDMMGENDDFKNLKYLKELGQLRKREEEYKDAIRIINESHIVGKDLAMKSPSILRESVEHLASNIRDQKQMLDYPRKEKDKDSSES